MAITHTSQATGRPSGTTGDGFTTSSIDTTGANFLHASISVFSGAGGYVAPTISDSKGNSWTALTSVTQGDITLLSWYSENATTGTGHTFTISTTDSFGALTVHAFAGVATSSSLDQQGGSANTASTTHQPGSLTPSQDNCLVISSLNVNGTSVTSIDGSFQAVDKTTNTGNTIDAVANEVVSGSSSYLIQTTAAAANPTWTVGASQVANVKLVVFKAAASTFIPRIMMS